MTLSGSADGERWRQRRGLWQPSEQGVSDGCELVWGQGTELPLCVSQDSVAQWLGYVAVVTKINYSDWKTFLHFFPHSPHPYTFFFFPFFFFFLGIGWIPNASHTKGIWWRRVGASLSEIILGRKKLLLTIYGSGAGFNQRKCLWLLHFHKQTGNTSLTNWLLKNLSDKFWFRHVTVQVSITAVMFALPLKLSALCRKRRRKILSGLKVG